MPVSAEEGKKYGDFIEELVKTLGCLEVNHEELVWHYTSGDALINIVESGKLYATQVSCLNDSTEVRYGENLVREGLVQIQTTDPRHGEEAAFLEQIIKTNAEANLKPQPARDWFVTCFSKEKDDLSQWRAYSGGENGYAIAFLAGAFFGRGSLVVRVNYNKEQHLAGAKKVAEATLQFYREGLESRSDDQRIAWADEFSSEWGRLTNRLAPMVKDPAFSGENEYRIVHEFTGNEMSALRFKQKQSLMSIHLPMVFPPPRSAIQSTLLPIMEVMVGPSRHKEISRISVDVLLRQKGYYNIPVTVSGIPFQTT